MDKIITFGISENFIQRLADTILEQCRQEGIALDKTAVIFGGKRPALFLKKELSRRRGAAYAPCRCFSIDEFTHYLVARDIPVRLISDMDACYLVYTIARDAAADILVKHKEFDQFLSWGRQIVSFIDELDLECVRNEQLIAIEESASIGYETPESINRLLEHITTIRSRYHAELAQRKLFSRGLLSLKALSLTESLPPLEFEKIYLANFYYLHKSQEQIIKRLYDADKAVLVFQKDGASWPAFERLAKTFGQAIEPTGQQATEYDVKLYKGFDGHSQVGLVRHILEQEIPAAQREKSVIVLSEPQNLIPLVTQISASVKDFNVSLGYPLERSSLFSLFRYMFQAQATRKGAAYYAKDYLQVLLHPLIKNLRVCAADAAPTRILCHKIEEMLLGMYENPLAGSLFVNLDDIEGQEALYVLTAASAASVDARVEITRLRQALQQIHQVWLRAWEDVGTFAELAVRLGVVCEILLSQSSLASYALNVLMLERIYEIKDELEGAYFKDERFQQQALFKILLDKLRNEVVNFSGSPLKGLQILGLLETRALTFDHVIVMDANESLLPKVQVYEPLIPRQIMEGLGLERLKQEEEIQRYHFMRLLGSAKKVYFVYDDNPEKEKSRFIEEILWSKRKETGRSRVFSDSRARFNVAGILSRPPVIAKDKAVRAYLRDEFTLSASSIDAYLGCPLKFYYQYMLGLREKEDMLAEPEARDIGTFLHNFLETAFGEFLNKEPVIDEDFKKRFFNNFEIAFESKLLKRWGQESFMIKAIMRERLTRLLENERARPVRKVLALEERLPAQQLILGDQAYRCKYVIDRIDELPDSSILVIDYKTGSAAKEPAGLSGLSQMELNRQAMRQTIHSFQLPLYCYFAGKRYPSRRVNAALYSLREIECRYFIKPDKLDTADEVMDICLRALAQLIGEMMDPDCAFAADKSDERACGFCAFRAMCA